MAKQSEFAKWFEAQHGKRPTHLALDYMRANVSDMRAALMRAEQLLELTLDWERRRDSALYAWNAKPEKAKP